MFLKFTTIDNIRDLGGVKTADGRVIVAKRLLRSSDLHRLSPQELAILKDEYHLKVVVDFRSTNSTIARKDQIDSSIKYYHKYTLEFLENNSYNRDITIDPDDFFKGVYRSLALQKEAIEAYAKFFRILIANNQGAILWHCTSGKDRTGIASALLLYILGCDMETIYYEHFRTNEVTLPMLETKLREINPNDVDSIKYYQAYYVAKKEFIDEYFHAIIERYVSLDDYIEKQIKVSKMEKDILRERYLTK